MQYKGRPFHHRRNGPRALLCERDCERSGVPLHAGCRQDNFMSKPIDVRKHACIYAGLQKNAGPSGIAVNIIRGDFASGACRLHQHVRTWLIAQASRNGVAHWRWLESPDDYVKCLYVSFPFSVPVEGRSSTRFTRMWTTSFQRTW